MSKVTSKELLKLSRLANLSPNPTQLKNLAPQLDEILSFVSTLQELDTSNTQEAIKATELENVFSKDQQTPSLDQKQSLSQANQTHQGYITVPAILKKTK